MRMAPTTDRKGIAAMTDRDDWHECPRCLGQQGQHWPDCDRDGTAEGVSTTYT